MKSLFCQSQTIWELIVKLHEAKRLTGSTDRTTPDPLGGDQDSCPLENNTDKKASNWSTQRLMIQGHGMNRVRNTGSGKTGLTVKKKKKQQQQKDKTTNKAIFPPIRCQKKKKSLCLKAPFRLTTTKRQSSGRVRHCFCRYKQAGQKWNHWDTFQNPLISPIPCSDELNVG